MKKFETLPENVQEEIKNTLKAFSKVSVTFENGEYHIGGDCLKATYASDYEWIGDYTADEVFTEGERIINYVEQFHGYPIEYNGNRDYEWLRNLPYDSKVKFDESGNLVTA